MRHGFLGRLGKKRASTGRTGAIVEHLEIILNASAGESATVPDFGLPDLTDLVRQIPEGVNKVEGSIRDAILKYEPRLDKVQVRFIPSEDPFSLYFEIVARHKGEQNKTFRARTELGPGGRFTVDRHVQ